MNASAKTEADRKALSFAMALSLAIGLFMAVIKVGAYLLTGSAAMLSDAAEAVVHMAAVIFAAYSLKLSYKTADESHLYGHAKIFLPVRWLRGGDDHPRRPLHHLRVRPQMADRSQS
jgi:Co/Zn/Cd efflux system component